MTKIKVALDVSNEECLGCDFFDLDQRGRLMSESINLNLI